ncbi:hypothetical protein [Olivibacter ginsenosidimutans]|uniref:hypothetical protein n=1 Tax=Olivibacter ginsenosidimutans TaxID=1176537 RepID=UPI0031EC1EEE
MKFEFHIPLRGLIGTEREMKYVEEIRPEARRRMRLHYQTVKYDIASKIAFYRELLEVFGSLEGQFLLYSIYLDQDSEVINLELETSDFQHIDLNKTNLSTFFQQNSPSYNNSSVKGFLKRYFTETLDLSSNEWEEEDGIRNPVTNKLIDWILHKITKDSTTNELRDFVLNYTKLWNTYFSNPYNLTKALILLHKFHEKYRNLDPQYLKIDLKTLLTDLNYFINELLPNVFNSPLTDVVQPSEIFKDGSDHNHLRVQSYLNKMSEFQERLTMNSVFFQDLGSLSWPDLLFHASTALPHVQTAYLNEIKRRHIINDVPKFNEIDGFIKKISMIKTPLNKDVPDSIATPNYLFFL